MDEIDPHLLTMLHVHALTSCDSTSGLFYIGKKSVMKEIQKQGADQFQDLQILAANDIDLAVDASRKLVAGLYD